MPYEEHPTFQAPDDPDSYIWRYMSFAKLLALLESKSLFFARADVLGKMDPYEGHLTHVNMMVNYLEWNMAPPELWAEKGFKSEKDLLAYVNAMKTSTGPVARTMREIHFINCWHLGNEESDAMWRLYTANHDGVCIQSTYNRLIEALQDAEDTVFIGKVQYLDYRKDSIDRGDGFAPFMSKRRAFQHEQELRAVVWRTDHMDYAYFNGDGSPATKDSYHTAHVVNKFPELDGLNVTVDIEKLVERIYISPTSQKWFVDTVSSVAAKLGFGFEFRHSELAVPPPA